MIRRCVVTATTLAGILAASPAQAQQAPYPAPPPPAYQDPMAAPPPPPPVVVDPMAPPPVTVAPAQPPMVLGPNGQPIMLAPRPPLPPSLVPRFRGGRVLYGVGTVFGLIGSGLSVASIFVTAGYGLDPSVQNSQIGPDLAYAGSATTAGAFLFSAVGLGMQHSALNLVGADPGYGLFATGTVFGILGLASMGASYYFGLTNTVPNSNVIGFGCSIASAALLTVGGLFFFSDNGRLGHIYRRLTTF